MGVAFRELPGGRSRWRLPQSRDRELQGSTHCGYCVHGTHLLPIDHDHWNASTPATRCAIGVMPVAVSLPNAPPTATPSSVMGPTSPSPGSPGCSSWPRCTAAGPCSSARSRAGPGRAGPPCSCWRWPTKCCSRACSTSRCSTRPTRATTSRAPPTSRPSASAPTGRRRSSAATPSGASPSPSPSSRPWCPSGGPRRGWVGPA
jgi:hypothetical protein